jgi:hypothetical protein
MLLNTDWTKNCIDLPSLQSMKKISNYQQNYQQQPFSNAAIGDDKMKAIHQ